MIAIEDENHKQLACKLFFYHRLSRKWSRMDWSLRNQSARFVDNFCLVSKWPKTIWRKKSRKKVFKIFAVTLCGCYFLLYFLFSKKILKWHLEFNYQRFYHAVLLEENGKCWKCFLLVRKNPQRKRFLAEENKWHWKCT